MTFENVQNPEHDVDPGDPFWVTGIGVKLKRRKPASPKWASRLEHDVDPGDPKWVTGIGG